MLKELMYKIFPKLLAKAISDEQDTNDQQSLDIKVLQEYDEKLQKNFYFYWVPSADKTLSGTDDNSLNATNITEKGRYFIGMQVKAVNTGTAGILTVMVYQNYIPWIAQTVNLSGTGMVNIGFVADFNKGVNINFVVKQSLNMTTKVTAEQTMCAIYKLN